MSNIAINSKNSEFAVSGWIGETGEAHYSFRIFSQDGRLLADPLGMNDDVIGEQAGLTYTLDGKLLLVGYKDRAGTVRVVDASSHIILRTLRTGAPVDDIAVDPTSAQFVTSHDFEAAVWAMP